MPPESFHGVLPTLATIAQLVMSLAFVILATGFLLIGLALFKAYRKIAPLVDKLQHGLDPLLSASRQIEERVRQLSALLKTFQDELESTFIGAAATVRGVRKGLGRMFDRGHHGHRDRPDRDEPNPDWMEEDEDDGYDNEPADEPEPPHRGASNARPAKPRIRRRRGDDGDA